MDQAPTDQIVHRHIGQFGKEPAMGCLIHLPAGCWMHSSLAHHSARYGNLRDLVTSEGNGSMYHSAAGAMVLLIVVAE